MEQTIEPFFVVNISRNITIIITQFKVTVVIMEMKCKTGLFKKQKLQFSRMNSETEN